MFFTLQVVITTLHFAGILEGTEVITCFAEVKYSIMTHHHTGINIQFCDFYGTHLFKID